MKRKLFYSFIFTLILIISLNNPVLANSEDNSINPDYIEIFDDIARNLDTIKVLNWENTNITDDFIKRFSELYNSNDLMGLYDYFMKNVAEITHLNRDSSKISLLSTTAQATYIKQIPRYNQVFYYQLGGSTSPYSFSWTDTLRVKYSYNTGNGQILSINENLVICDIEEPGFTFNITMQWSHSSTPSNVVNINNKVTITPYFVSSDGWQQVALQTRTFTVSGTITNPLLN